MDEQELEAYLQERERRENLARIRAGVRRTAERQKQAKSREMVVAWIVVGGTVVLALAIASAMIVRKFFARDVAAEERARRDAQQHAADESERRRALEDERLESINKPHDPNKPYPGEVWTWVGDDPAAPR